MRNTILNIGIPKNRRVRGRFVKACHDAEVPACLIDEILNNADRRFWGMFSTCVSEEERALGVESLMRVGACYGGIDCSDLPRGFLT